jgi:hypothetical protein
MKPGLMAHAYNSSYSGREGRRIESSRPAPAKNLSQNNIQPKVLSVQIYSFKVCTSIFNLFIMYKSQASGAVECLPSKCWALSSNLSTAKRKKQTCPKNQKNKTKTTFWGGWFKLSFA